MTLDVIAGELPNRVRNLVIEWAVDHRIELMDDWDLMRNDQKPNKIKPLV